MLIKTNWWHKLILMKSGMCQQKCSLRQERVFGSDRRYWSQQMNTALGVAGMAGFPYQLSPMKTKKALPIPAVDFTSGVKPEKNLQPNHEYLRDPRCLLRDKIQRNLSTNQPQAQHSSQIQEVARWT